MSATLHALPVPPPVKPVGAVAAALRILRCIGRHAESVRLSDIVREEGLNPSTTLNILRTLEHEGLVGFDVRSKRYALADGLADLVAPVLGRRDAGRRAGQAMTAAAQELGATIGMWKRVGDEVELVRVGESSDAMRIAFTVGRRLPMFLGAMGRLVAARGDWSEMQLQQGFAAVPWARAPNYGDWRRQVEESRACDTGVDRGNVTAGILGVAVPVERDGPLVHILAAALFDAGQHPDLVAVAERLRSVAAAAAN
ncbi:IclR family transcriptional regulator [Polymorphobacter glacialis]|uniref:IclR family transcriptional regulator n=1 Tax=Sandarakinorhabdus glacialis TaxID=1614636 RepID=A0A917E9L3_9SPHN|nr:helix-turn-helix domain-containing protein [Polymorphobacter glacialis]GGE14154.1 IclR family transcriptional regulator [Polymorphobacter glacialis]